MTNELAIRILTGDVLGTTEQTQEAVTMAVKALSKPDVTDTNIGDTISRQAAIDALDEYIEEYSYDLDENGYHNPKWCAMQEAKMTIQRLPSAERRGRWEDIEHAPNGLLYATCSVCGERQTIETTNYCGNCGADMREGDK